MGVFLRHLGESRSGRPGPMDNETMQKEIGSETLLPRGVKDFLPLNAAKIEHLQQTLKKVFFRWGFRPVITPSLEYLPTLERGLGEELREATFRLDDRQSGRLVAFPPDITPQVARIVATRMREMPLPLRLCYSGRVLRHTEHQAGKDREIFQSGVELIGLDSPEADAEMIAMAVECLQKLGAEEFTIDVGQVEFFRGVMAGLPLSDEMARKIQVAIARKDVSGLRELLPQTALDDAVREEILALPRLFGGREVLSRATVVTNDRSKRALDYLHRVLETLESYGVEKYVTLDLGELRGLGYHTGLTFQGFLTGMGRAVCSGGRYDNLTGRYGRPAPATGFTFNLLNLLFALEKQLDAVASLHTDVLIFQADSDKRSAQQVARILREQGFSVARDIIPRSLEKSLDYAHRMNFNHVLVVDSPADLLRLIPLQKGAERRFSLTAVINRDLTVEF